MRLLSARLLVLASVTVAALPLAGCSGPPPDLAAVLKVGNVTTGWFDAGVVDGKNKLVPSASFSITNTSDRTLDALQIYTVFRFLNETEELGSSLVVLRGKEALGPSATSKVLTSRGTWGFTSEEPRAQMLMHDMFKDAKVEIFAKYGAANFVKLSEIQLKRQLLTQ
jgi:hypothetical protein